MEANNNNDEHHHQQQADDDDNAENEEDDDAVVAAVFLKLNTILQRRKDFPFRQRNKIVELAKDYLDSLEDDIHEMLCDQTYGEDYRGLDSNRDTEAEVETALQFYPNLLSQRKDVIRGYNEEGEQEWVDAPDGEGCLPIQCLLHAYNTDGNYRHNLKAISFVAVIARLGKESNQYTKEERGGLWIEDRDGFNTLWYLVFVYDSTLNEDYHQLVDNLCLTQMIQLRRTDLFKKEDICDQFLVSNVLSDDFFPETILRFLAEWNPLSLVHTDANNDLPLHLATYSNLIQGFQVVFDTVIRYYPNKKGICLLFTTNNFNRTPFQNACDQYQYEPVMKIVEDTLTRYAADGTPLHVVDALLTAATDGDIHLDGVYTLLRRHPVVLMKRLSVQPKNNNDGSDDNDNDDDDGGGDVDDTGDGDGDNEHDDDDNDDNCGLRRIRKRRRI